MRVAEDRFLPYPLAQTRKEWTTLSERWSHPRISPIHDLLCLQHIPLHNADLYLYGGRTKVGRQLLMTHSSYKMLHHHHFLFRILDNTSFLGLQIFMEESYILFKFFFISLFLVPLHIEIENNIPDEQDDDKNSWETIFKGNRSGL